MSRSDVMGLGPFLKALTVRLEGMTKEEISRVLIRRAKTIPAIGRRGFLADFEFVPPAAPVKTPASDDKRLLVDIHAFVADLEKGRYYEGTGFDKDVREYRSYGDESWVERMDALFDRAADAFLNGRKASSAEAYGLLLHAFDMGEEDGHFCGATSATDMVATDLDEAMARYFRSIYETTSAQDRPALLLKKMYALRYRGHSEPGIKAVFDAEPVPPPEWNAFLEGWIEHLRAQDPDDGNILRLQMMRRLLREAVMFRDGLAGLARLADEIGAKDPALFQEWIAELLRLNRKDEACDVARRATATVCDPHRRAAFAEQWTTLTRNSSDVLEARRVAWRVSPTLGRLLLLYTANTPTPEEADHRIREELAQLRSRKPGLDDRLTAILRLLAGDYNAAAAIMAKSDPVGWNYESHPGAVVYPAMLLAIAGSQPLPTGSVLSLWRHELDALDRIDAPTLPEQATAESQPAVGLWATVNAVLTRKPLTKGQRERLLDLTHKVMQSRVKAIAGQQHRGAYDRAARVLVGWVEAARLAGRAKAAEALLEQTRKDYSRRPAFRREIDALLTHTTRGEP